MASGDLLLLFQPANNEPPAVAPATPDQRNSHPVLDFDASTDEIAIFTGIIPPNYSGGGITAKVHFAMTSATSGNVIWQTAFERVGTSQDIDSDSFATANSSSATAVSGTSGIPSVASIAHANGSEIDSVAVGEAFRVKLNRDADNGSDTATGDAELIALALYET